MIYLGATAIIRSKNDGNVHKKLSCFFESIENWVNLIYHKQSVGLSISKNDGFHETAESFGARKGGKNGAFRGFVLLTFFIFYDNISP